MIQIQSVHFQLGHKVLLENANLKVFTGNKLGIIGANGCGKSSLFKLILRTLKEDAGEIHIPSNWRISHMAQEVSASDESAQDYILSGDQVYREIEREIEQCQDVDHGDKLAAAYAKMETIDGYTAPARAQRLLHGLGFLPTDADRSVSDFSGGWRIRLNLARALMCPSDLLLLDEPTNHLDLDATLWLEQWLQNYSGTLLIISHDRDFLDNIVESIINIHQQTIETYSGNYSAYEKQKAERLAQQASAFTKQQERISEIESFVRRFKAKATKAKQAQSRIKELERMELIAPAHVDSPFSFRFPKPERCPQTLINLTEANLGYKATGTTKSEKTIVKNLEFAILGSSRIGLLGANGAGKSTLIKTLTNELPLISGEKIESPHLMIGYFAQHQLESLDLNASPALHLQRITPKASEQEIRNFLGGFDFRGDRAFESIQHFSGGEKARLALAIVAWQKPNFLVLDEPTNHLDLEMRHALTLAIQEFEGALILVSHDRHLLKNAVDQYMIVNDGIVEPFDGTLEDYQRHLNNQKLEKRSSPKNNDSISSNKTYPNANEESSTTHRDNTSLKTNQKNDRQTAAKIRQQLKPYSQEVNKLEKEIEKLTNQLNKIDNELADPSLYEGETPKLQELLKKQGDTKKELGQKEEQWFEKSDALEQMKTELS